jgi:hypothetical protein
MFSTHIVVQIFSFFASPVANISFALKRWYPDENLSAMLFAKEGNIPSPQRAKKVEKAVSPGEAAFSEP